MKSIRYILGLGAIAGCMILGSCTEEVDSPGIKEKVTEGIPVTAVLSYDTSSASIVSRATAEEENAVTDLYVLIFNASNGSFESATYFTNEDLDNLGRNKITLNTTSGAKKLYAVANTGSNTFAVGERMLKDEIDEFLDSSPSLSEWLDFSMTMAEEQVTWSGGQGTFTMSGYFVPTADAAELNGDVLPGDGTCTITAAGTPNVPGKLQLVRVASQITFKITNGGNSKGTFTPTGWEVHNVPKSLYMNRQTDAGTPKNTSYFSRTGGTLNQGSFNFYMPENRQTTAKAYSGDDLGKAQMNWREAYSTADDAKVFTNAPAAGTYVVLHGTYSGEAKNPFNNNKDGEAQATVTYYIHLGYADGVTDFSIPRNAKYTYNITVAGVDDIIVEVINENRPSNPSDGHVLFYDAEIIEADAHYERREITLNCSMNDFICGIETAKTAFNYYDLDDLNDTNRDIDWVHFMLKSRAEELNHRIKFPSSGEKSDGLMNVAELTEYIESNASSGDQDFYVYIAENYYEGMEYSKFVNDEKGIGEAKSRRMMISISRNYLENSSVSSTRYIIQQKPITTIFNLRDGVVSGGNPWGMEWSNENLSGRMQAANDWEGRAQAGIQKSAKNLQSNANDGYANTLAAIGRNGINVDHADIDWENYPNANNALPYAACMSRNRDENGNGRIDQDEIKWYLPANNQMQYLWIGMDAVPEDAVLYPVDFRNANQWQYYHYATSDSKVFWAEEGCAISPIAESSANRLHVRCMRNLGTGEGLLIGEKSMAEEDRGDVIVTVGDRLPDGVFRQGLSTGKLGIHNEYGDDNKIYKKMQIKGETLRETVLIFPQIWTGTFKQAADRVYDRNTDPCAERYGRGWRSPSQREMILITTVGGFNGSMHTVTYYSFWDYTNERALAYNPDGNGLGNTRVGFSYSDNQLQLITPGSANGSGGNIRNIRCVKDYIN